MNTLIPRSRRSPGTRSSPRRCPRLGLVLLAALASGAVPPGPARAADGDVRHRVDMIDPIEKSTPAVAPDGRLFVTDTEGFVMSYHPATQQRVSRYLSGAIVSAPVLGHDGTVYVGTTATQQDNFFALDPTTLEVKKRFKASGAIRASATIGRDWTLYVGTDLGHVYALDPETLREKWTRSLHVYEDGTGVRLPVEAGCALSGDGTLYVPTAAGSRSDLVALDSRTGQTRWRHTTAAGILRDPALGPDGRVIFVDRDGFVAAVTPKGARLWLKIPGRSGATLTSPVVGSQGEIYVGSSDKNLYCLSPDGAVRWSFSTSGSAIAGAPALGANGLLYFGAVKKFFCLRASDGGLVWQRQLDKGTRDVGNVVITSDNLAWFAGGTYLFGVEVGTSLAGSGFWPTFRGTCLRQGIAPFRQIQPVLGVPYRRANGQTVVVLWGQPGVTYRLEGSTHFGEWDAQGSYSSRNGVVAVPLAGPGMQPCQFYRAVATSP